MPDKRAMLEAAGAYLKQHPDELLQLGRKLIGLRVGVPLDALRWLARQAKGKRAPRDVEIEAVPPGVRLGASLDLMNTPVRVSAVIYVEHVSVAADELRFALRLADVRLKVLDETADTPVAALIKSGALDLSKPGNLAAFIPKRPAVLVEAADDRIVLDFKKHPKLANGRVDRVLGIVAPLLTLAAIETDESHLDLALRAFPDGAGEALQALRRAL